MKPFHDLHKRIKSDVETVMTLRDYFAAKAMQAMLTTPKEITHKGYKVKNEEEFAQMAYIMADEMIKEREKTNG